MVSLLFPLQLLPALFAQAFAGFGAPFNAGRHFFLVNIITAFAAFYSGFVGKNLHLVPADRALVERYRQISSILSWTMADHIPLLTAVFLS
jgi:hypothetical protein